MGVGHFELLRNVPSTGVNAVSDLILKIDTLYSSLLSYLVNYLFVTVHLW